MIIQIGKRMLNTEEKCNIEKERKNDIMARFTFSFFQRKLERERERERGGGMSETEEFLGFI